jgi:hypothetical protein
LKKRKKKTVLSISRRKNNTNSPDLLLPLFQIVGIKSLQFWKTFLSMMLFCIPAISFIPTKHFSQER